MKEGSVSSLGAALAGILLSLPNHDTQWSVELIKDEFTLRSKWENNRKWEVSS